MNTQHQVEETFERLVDQLEGKYKNAIQNEPRSWQVFRLRLDTHFETLFQLLFRIYGAKDSFYLYLEELLLLMAENWFGRQKELKEIDQDCENDPDWFLSNQMVGGVCYVDLFAGDLAGVHKAIPYFKELGLNYLHLMPLFRTPDEESDGGYAVSSYREVNPALGTMGQLSALTAELRNEGIHLALDFVFNHTADNHEWAIKAKAGDGQFRNYYFMFPDRTLPDAYEQHLREIFPQERHGSFTYVPEIERWVWTTFNSFQWDLNYANQAVFNSMAGEMLFLANIGIRFLRLDAVAFIWKQMGTMCENLPQAHWIIQAYNAILKIVAPSVLFKSEAIVHPDEVIKYIDLNECQISYNPLLMATLWESLATRKVELLEYSLSTRFGTPAGTTWVNYVRVHDDIGWTFSDEDAAKLGINGFDHRKFLNEFYTGRFPGSFARGLPFQFNPKTQDLRISGTCASLAGLEKAIEVETEKEVELAIRRIVLLYSVIISIGGIPIIYLGDELGTLNDYTFVNDEKKVDDTRWVHRIKTDWEKVEERKDPEKIAGRVYSRLRHLIDIRKSSPVFSGKNMEIINLDSPHVLGYRRRYKSEQLIVLANFCEEPQGVHLNQGNHQEMDGNYIDLVTGNKQETEFFNLAPYQFVWLKPVE